MIEPDLDQDQGRAIDEDIHLMMIQNQDRKKKRKRNIKTTKEKIIKRIEKEGYVRHKFPNIFDISGALFTLKLVNVKRAQEMSRMNEDDFNKFFNNQILGSAWTS